jgi:hypothetical protein
MPSFKEDLLETESDLSPIVSRHNSTTTTLSAANVERIGDQKSRHQSEAFNIYDSPQASRGRADSANSTGSGGGYGSDFEPDHAEGSGEVHDIHNTGSHSSRGNSASSSPATVNGMF